MPFVFGIIGLVLIVTGIRDTITNSNPSLVSLLKSDLTGKPNYIEWMFAIGVVGALGYIDSLKGLSRAFMTLIVVVLILDNKGFFAELASSVQQISQNPPTATNPNQTMGTASNPTNVNQSTFDTIEQQLMGTPLPSTPATNTNSGASSIWDSLSDDNIFKAFGL
jgi:hypothetical protein